MIPHETSGPRTRVSAHSSLHQKMNLLTTLTGSHLRTYQAIFQHPLAHNLHWHDVHALFRHVCQVDEEPNGNLKVTRNRQTLVLHPVRTKDVSETDEVLKLRHFLQNSEPTATEPQNGIGHWLLVIDHREARIYRSTAAGTLPQQILPHTAEDYFRHAPNSRQISRGKEKPEPNSYFEPIAAALRGADKILMFGNGTGTSSEMDQFAGWLTKHHADLARRIVATVVVDGHHLTEAQLLAQARNTFAQPGGRQA